MVFIIFHMEDGAPKKPVTQADLPFEVLTQVPGAGLTFSIELPKKVSGRIRDRDLVRDDIEEASFTDVIF